MRLLFASQNNHKRIEMASLLLAHEIVMPSEIGLEFDFDETADTFIGNALGKAEHLYQLTGKPSFADDSGLAVDALDGAPGIFSARFGSNVFNRMLDSPERNQYLLEQIKGVPMERRTARFVCAIALVYEVGRIYVVQETVEGYVTERPYGNGGFGYDPIFLVGEAGKTMAELTDQEKNRVSHRGNAARRMQTILHSLEERENIYVC